MLEFFDPTVPMEINGFAVEPIVEIPDEPNLEQALRHAMQVNAGPDLAAPILVGSDIGVEGEDLAALIAFGPEPMLASTSTIAIAAPIEPDIFWLGPRLAFGWAQETASYDGGDGKEEEIVVKGKNPNVDSPIDKGGWDTGGGGGDAGGGPAGGDGGGPAGDPPPQEPNDCRDRSALTAQTDIRGESDWQQKEHGVLIYRDGSGAVQRSSIIEGGALSISQAAIQQWLDSNGVSMSQVIGFVHNHPAWQYAEAAEANRYPSGGAVAGGDWNAADWMVAGGAGGAGGSNFALYVIDVDGVMREFNYSSRDFYKNLSREDRQRGVGLPNAVTSDGSTCP